MASCDELARQLRSTCEGTDEARKRAMKECRESIRSSSRAIRAVHRLEFTDAWALLKETRERVEGVKAVLATHPSLFHAGYVHDSQKEYVEAEAMYAIVQGESLPSPSALGVEPAAYLNG